MKTQASKKTRPTFSYGGTGVSPALCIACDDSYLGEQAERKHCELL